MILIETRVAPSGIHGNGLFAGHAIRAGTPFYRFQPGFDQSLTPEHWAALPEPARGFVRHFSYFDGATRRLILSGDDARFMNHSETPNTGALPGSTEPIVTVALREIAAGEELTCDYRAFDGDVAWKLGRVEDDSPLGAGWPAEPRSV